LTGKTASSVPSIRVWLLELYVRGCLKLGISPLKEIEGGDTLSNRQCYLIRGLNGDVNYFRKQKTRFVQKNGFEQYAFLLGATCLPKDELTAWVSSVKASMVRPLDGLFCDWIKSQRGRLVEIIEARSELAKEQTP
jgi:hypothetical protein